MFLFITWTIYRFATAGPKRRGKRRLEPVPPPGVHMPGGSFAPLLAAFGCFMLVFGLVTGGFWLWIGTRSSRSRCCTGAARPCATTTTSPSASTALVTTGGTGLATGATLPPGPLPARRGFAARRRPHAGSVVPPAARRDVDDLAGRGARRRRLGLIFGFIALTVTLLEWLRDARHEYALAQRADRTGHLDNGPRPNWPTATFAILALLLAGGLLMTSGLLPNSGTPAASEAPRPRVAARRVAAPPRRPPQPARRRRRHHRAGARRSSRRP